MRIYNGTNSQVVLPYSGGQMINIGPKSVSGNVGPTNELISLIVTSFGTDELAMIVSGPYELSMTSGNPVAVGYVVQSLDEAIQRFAPKSEVKKEEVKEEVKKEEPAPVVEEVKSEDPAPKPVEVKEEVKKEEPAAVNPPKKRGRPAKKKTDE